MNESAEQPPDRSLERFPEGTQWGDVQSEEPIHARQELERQGRVRDMRGDLDTDMWEARSDRILLTPSVDDFMNLQEYVNALRHWSMGVHRQEFIGEAEREATQPFHKWGRWAAQSIESSTSSMAAGAAQPGVAAGIAIGGSVLQTFVDRDEIQRNMDQAARMSWYDDRLPRNTYIDAHTGQIVTLARTIDEAEKERLGLFSFISDFTDVVAPGQNFPSTYEAFSNDMSELHEELALLKEFRTKRGLGDVGKKVVQSAITGVLKAFNFFLWRNEMMQHIAANARLANLSPELERLDAVFRNIESAASSVLVHRAIPYGRSCKTSRRRSTSTRALWGT